MDTQTRSIEDVKEYYGKVLGSKDDLKTSACCTAEAMPRHLRPLLKKIHPEIQDKFYGCGSPMPPALEGATVLDLGSGTGRDCYMISQLVGPSGRVIGVDMTDEQIQVAKKHIDHHTKEFGFSEPNVDFRQGYIEDLKSVDIADNSMDLVISNCVLNLSPAKDKVFAEIFRVLKPGGELYFSDVFSDRRIPKELFDDPVLLGECLSGAMYIEDFRRTLASLGCADYRVVSSTPLELHDPEVVQKIGFVNFYSITMRAFKLNLEDRCEDFGQVAYYNGTVPEHPHSFALDDHHVFKAHQPMPICSNTADMLTKSRYEKHFRVEGNTSRHFGLFDCGPNPSVSSSTNSGPAGACC